jgi:hypothetical protein
MPAKQTTPRGTMTDHEFLEYESVTVFFVFCGIWDTERLTFDHLVQSFRSKTEFGPKPEVSKIHARSLNLPWVTLNRVYQPSFVGCDTAITIETSGRVPVTLNALDIGGDVVERIPAKIGCCVRILASGGVVCNYDLSIDCQATKEGKAVQSRSKEMFRHTHSALRLAHSTTQSGETHKGLANLQFDSTLIDAIRPFLAADFADGKTHSVGDLFTQFLTNPADIWKVKDDENTPRPIWSERVRAHAPDGHAACNMGGHEWQSPFVITLAKVSDASYARLQQGDDGLVREVCSMLCKQTLEYQHVSDNFLRMNLQYARDKGLCDADCNILHNYCLDDRAFFAFSERGALFMSADFEAIPAVFVAASFVNALEIVRSRWLFGCELSTRLNQLIDRFTAPDAKDRIDDRAEEAVSVRKIYSKFVHDPTDYLLDGGSVTEIARKAERDFAILDIESDVRHKLNALDSIRRDLDIMAIEAEERTRGLD